MHEWKWILRHLNYYIKEMNTFIQQKCIKLIKSAIKDISNVTNISISNKKLFF